MYRPVPWLATAAQFALGGQQASFAACIRLATGVVRCSKSVERTAEESELSDVSGLQNDIVDLGVGTTHACAVRANGTVRCWGKNDHGQLGDSTAVSSDQPVTVKELNDAVDVSVYGESTCARRKSGTVVCWGKNENGQLGDGTHDGRHVPVMVKGVSGAREVGVGGTMGCAVTETGMVQCWGDGRPTLLGKTLDTEPVPSIENPTSLAIGRNHGCARLANGTVRCWGDNRHGQLGDGTRVERRMIPSSVHGLADTISIVASESSTCARLVSGAIRCWGSGDGSRARQGPWYLFGAPVRVELERTAQIALGAYHTCARTIQGHVYCWGDNTYGELGNDRQAIQPRPVEVQGLTDVVQITASNTRTCARRSDDTLWCWGGGVGPIDTNRAPLRPRPEKLFDDVVDVALAGVKRYFPRVDTCVRRKNGTVWCWRDDPMKAEEKRTAPAIIPGIFNAKQLAIGGKYSCALLATGEVRCWGQHLEDLLAVGAMIPVDATVIVRDLPPVGHIANCGFHTCGVAKKDEKVYCWGGLSSSSELKQHVEFIRAQTLEVVENNRPLHLQPDAYWACVLLHRGWESCSEMLEGHGVYLLEGMMLNALPKTYSDLPGIHQLVLGAQHGCVLRNEGTVLCKGFNQFGQLGNGDIHGEWVPE
ncbi:RCC1 domain-containing protein [Polyangium sp. y55x31]|uniref:RCC1 domain-containing protein n=1 Tax=Polyangium sp. y55x31 TaxID=3042688 RepID=UPI002483227D|nr:RCC1 domain-containing protein [Polyangium sp. y55x31]MDI1476733.1 hypothetical protein [Polyangium sp. y55x31]